MRLNHGVRAQRDIAGRKDFQLRTPASANHSNSFISTLLFKKPPSFMPIQIGLHKTKSGQEAFSDGSWDKDFYREHIEAKQGT